MDSKTTKIVSIIGGVAALAFVIVLGYLGWNSYSNGGKVATIYTKAKGLTNKTGVSRVYFEQKTGEGILQLWRLRFFDKDGNDITQDTPHSFKHSDLYSDKYPASHFMLDDFDHNKIYHSSVGGTAYLEVSFKRPIAATKMIVYTVPALSYRFKGATIAIYKEDEKTLALPKITINKSQATWEFDIPTSK